MYRIRKCDYIAGKYVSKYVEANYTINHIYVLYINPVDN